MDKKLIVKNFAYAFLANGVQLLLSVMMTLVISKILGVNEYSYWQLFIFYSNYVGFVQLGLNDGIYLKYGGYDYKELPYDKLKTQFIIMMIQQAIITVIIASACLLLLDNNDRKFVIVILALYAIIVNVNRFFGYIFQTTNNTSWFSISIIIDQCSFVVIAIASLLFGYKNYQLFIVFYTVTKLFTLIYCVYKGKEILSTKFRINKNGFREYKGNLAPGMSLLIANMVSSFIIGISRVLVDVKWGIETFGKISFSISLTNFFLAFIAQISMVVFPVLKRVDKNNSNSIYKMLHDIVNIILPIIYVLYVPIGIILLHWLPQYKESIAYLGYMIPICVFDGKMQLLSTTYYKVLRKEKTLLRINISTLIMNTLLSLCSVFIFNNVLAVVFSIVCAIIMRSIIADVILCRYLNCSFIKSIIQELIFALLFIIANIILSSYISFAILVMFYGAYLLFNKEKILEIKNFIFYLQKGK
ncbi:O-antigen/teichoic acid export membrane protein [Clostridium tetanomorphum]|uniref:lipopolysaccharide biosynthesis protein n=1 Tax=Clostridium tetanomorphum TaxID=1553 RepID=UPI00044E4531|nr:oligosaccharide flippase family protein [Clostridium tetanomorphum]KAJ49015.1 heteropolysaccharide repeat-containing protein [Clostridium tetanomorphum DSM 665]KAJ52108.1 heteropolysaccharide repeat-containing protein [Clostridium tetanomorphum DSM 665]MBP1863030.1 O-antigen/teichoic acid export membrane protein [Clostridium tetanomorphum]NRS82859.1 O-antigen/teichoic acid export membrane protein [Clostridium tetanomorphum]SQC03226.1 membrane protein involved in the export of O-antigen and 